MPSGSGAIRGRDLLVPEAVRTAAVVIFWDQIKRGATRQRAIAHAARETGNSERSVRAWVASRQPQ